MTELPPFLTLPLPHLDSSHEVELIRKARIKSWDRFLEMGFPSRDDGVYRSNHFLDLLYATPLLPLLASEAIHPNIAPFLLPDCLESYLVFLNGYFRSDLSEVRGLQGVIIQPLAQAARSFHALMSGSWTRLLQDEIDPFSLLNLASFQDGIFIYVPPHQKVRAPLHILSYIQDAEGPSWSMPRLHIVLGRHAELTLIETSHAAPSDNLIYLNNHITCEIEEGANLHHAITVFDTDMNRIIHTNSLRAYLKADSQLSSTSYIAPKLASRFSSAVWLKGENASASLQGSWMLSKEQEAHTHVHIQHDEPHCRSMQLYKGVLQDRSRSSFEGKIYVHQEAQKTEAYQLNNNLLLGKTAQALSKPNLEIYADDVKASHGATTGQLDKEALFYLQSRGLSKSQAQICLIEGFLTEAATSIDVPSLHERVIEKIHSFCS